LRIVFQEIKKIFHPVMLLLLVAINCLMYYIFIDFDITVFPNGRPATDMYHIGIEMVGKYGHELDEAELEDFKAVLAKEIAKADEYIQSDQDFMKLGITSYQKLQEMRDEDSAIEELHSKIIFDKGLDLFWEIPERESIIEDMEFVNERYGYSFIEGDLNQKQEQRIQEIIDSGSVKAIFPSYPVEYNFETISKSIAITILVSVLFMISPIFIRDYKNNMIGLQYSSKIGRGMFKKKLTAGMLSAFLITTILVIVYYSLYSTNNIGMFLDSGINSFIGKAYWYDLSFLQLIIVTILLTYVLTLSMALLAIFVSSICKNYISIIGILFPLFVVAYYLIMKRALPNEAFSISRSQWEFSILYSIVVLFPLIVIFWKKRVEMMRDVLE